MIFISSENRDFATAQQIAQGLEKAGYNTWHYVDSSLPGPTYLEQVLKAIDESEAIIIIISPHSIVSSQVNAEIIYAFEKQKKIIPLLLNISHEEFQERKSEWRIIIGAAVSIRIPLEGVEPILPRIISGLKMLGIALKRAPFPEPEPSPPSDKTPVKLPSGVEQHAPLEERKHPPPPKAPRTKWLVTTCITLVITVIFLGIYWVVSRDSKIPEVVKEILPERIVKNNKVDENIYYYTNEIKAKPDDAKAYYQRGKIYKEIGEYNRALSDFDKAILLKSNFYWAYYNRGELYLAKKDYGLALNDFNKAISLKSDEAWFYNKRGELYLDKGDINLAIEDFNKSLTLKGDFPWSYYNRAVAYYRKGDYSRARQDIHEAQSLGLTVDPKILEDLRQTQAMPRSSAFAAKSVKDYIQTGNQFSKNRQYDRAIEVFTQAINLDPSKSDGYHHRGFAYLDKEQYDAAIRDFQQALRLNPQDDYAYHHIGFAYYRKGQYDLAIENCQRAIEINPKSSRSYQVRGLAYDGKGQHNLAIADFSRAIDLDQNDAEPYLNKAEACEKVGRTKEALEAYQSFIKFASPQDFPQEILKAKAKIKALGKKPHVVTESKQEPKKNLPPEYPGMTAVAYGQKGDAFLEKSQFDSAISYYTKAIQVDPKDQYAYHQRGFAYFKKGQYDQAISDLKHSLILLPKNYKAHYILGLVYGSQGQYEQAISHLNRSLEIDPQRPQVYWNKAGLCEKAGRIREAVEAYKDFSRYAVVTGYAPRIPEAKKKIEALEKKLAK